MADFDKYDYEINKRLPEWYKHVNGLEPINRYTQELLISILEGFLKNLGLVQPIQVWKTLPEEYNWEHKYYNKDIWVGNTTLNEKADLKISNDKPLFLKIPNTKRPTDAVIDIHFTGNKNNQTIKHRPASGINSFGRTISVCHYSNSIRTASVPTT